jgi:23S rRNA pseudouridine1911/1915/1917 synthase
MSRPEHAWSVSRDEGGVRLDKFLAAADRLGSRGRAADAVARGKVFLNGSEATHVDAARKLAAGDVVSVWMDRPGTARRRAPGRKGELDVVFEDSHLIVVNKPAGLLAVPLARRGEAPSLYDLVEQHLRPRGKRTPMVVHRIDRDTSGLVVFAKDPRSQEALKRQFLRHEPERVYLAVVYGTPSPRAGTWRDRLVWDRTALIQKETHPRDPRGKDAVATYRVVEEFGSASLLEVRLKTGKRNQIRLQARLRGHTLVGETRYTYGSERLRPIPFERQALHAWRLRLRHPASGEPLEFEAPIPGDLTALIATLRTG